MTNRRKGFFRFWGTPIAVFLAVLFAPISTPFASSYSERQLDSLAERIGRTYWVASVNNRTPTFLSAAATKASSFHPEPNESFEISDLVGRKTDHPYYKVKFASGKEGYISPDSFHEELNLTILSVDPQANAKKKAAVSAEEEKKRVDWIKAQPWSQAVKDAAMQGRPVPGMNMNEVKRLLGNPNRKSQIKAPQRTEEHWFYPNGSVLIFRNGQLTRVETKEKTNN